MPRPLRISVGQHSDRGRKQSNQDFYGVLIPDEPQLSLKGIAVALADGISTSDVSAIASESAVKSFLMDYYCTSEAWSVKTSAYRVIAATNSWLHAQNHPRHSSYDKDKGYVCTLSAIVFKATTAHIFHVGDCRVYRASGGTLEQLTNDHRITISEEENYLGRALGVNEQIEIDYHPVPISTGDVFLLVTDGVYEHLDPRFVARTIEAHGDDLDRAAALLVDEALRQGSNDNLTAQIIRIEQLPDSDYSGVLETSSQLPMPTLLDARDELDGYRIVRELHASSRSHVYLAVDLETDAAVVLKIPSIDLRDDPAYRRRFMMEEWIARRIDSPYILKPYPVSRKRNYLYVVMEFVDGQTLTQWINDHARPDLESVRGIVEQIARGVRAFHRMEMLHQDLRPENILIDGTGTVKIIDFGSTSVAGVIEATPSLDRHDVLGTEQYTAPECLLGNGGTRRSDMFSLGVIAYQLLTGRLPYGADAARVRTAAQVRKLRYRSAQDDSSRIPPWIDAALKRAVHPLPDKRYDSLSEFTHDLRHPNPNYAGSGSPPLIERDPVMFWKSLCLLLAGIIAVLLAIRQL